MEEASEGEEATRPPPTGDEGEEETQGSNNGIVNDNAEGFTRENFGLSAVSEYMVEEGPLDDSTREEGGFSVPPTATSFYSLQVIGQIHYYNVVGQYRLRRQWSH